MASTIKQRLRRYNGTDYDTVHLESSADMIIKDSSNIGTLIDNLTSYKSHIGHFQTGYADAAGGGLAGILANTAYDFSLGKGDFIPYLVFAYQPADTDDWYVNYTASKWILFVCTYERNKQGPRGASPGVQVIHKTHDDIAIVADNTVSTMVFSGLNPVCGKCWPLTLI